MSNYPSPQPSLLLNFTKAGCVNGLDVWFPSCENRFTNCRTFLASMKRETNCIYFLNYLCSLYTPTIRACCLVWWMVMESHVVSIGRDTQVPIYVISTVTSQRHLNVKRFQSRDWIPVYPTSQLRIRGTENQKDRKRARFCSPKVSLETYFLKLGPFLQFKHFLIIYSKLEFSHELKHSSIKIPGKYIRDYRK